MERAGAPVLRLKTARLLGLRTKLELGGAAGSREPADLARLALLPRVRRRRGCELLREGGRAYVIPRPVLDRARFGLVHTREGSAEREPRTPRDPSGLR